MKGEGEAKESDQQTDRGEKDKDWTGATTMATQEIVGALQQSQSHLKVRLYRYPPVKEEEEEEDTL